MLGDLAAKALVRVAIRILRVHACVRPRGDRRGARGPGAAVVLIIREAAERPSFTVRRRLWDALSVPTNGLSADCCVEVSMRWRRGATSRSPSGGRSWTACPPKHSGPRSLRPQSCPRHLVPNNDLVLAGRPSQGVWRLRYGMVSRSPSGPGHAPTGQDRSTESLSLIEQRPGSAIETELE